MATEATESTRITIDLGTAELYRRLRHASVDDGRSVRAIVTEAVERWLDEHEDAVDLRVSRERKGGHTMSWDEMRAALPDLDPRND